MVKNERWPDPPDHPLTFSEASAQLEHLLGIPSEIKIMVHIGRYDHAELIYRAGWKWIKAVENAIEPFRDGLIALYPVERPPITIADDNGIEFVNASTAHDAAIKLVRWVLVTIATAADGTMEEERHSRFREVSENFLQIHFPTDTLRSVIQRERAHFLARSKPADSTSIIDTRKSDTTERDKAWAKEYRDDKSLYASMAAFARSKNKKPNTMRIAISRGSKALRPPKRGVK